MHKKAEHLVDSFEPQLAEENLNFDYVPSKKSTHALTYVSNFTRRCAQHFLQEQ